jgi:hypothetical protein
VTDSAPAPTRLRNGAAEPTPAVRLAGTGVRRKSSGTFYTPREMTDYVVRQALDPLVAGRSPEEILALKVLDPAMGSGAFLVAACHHLARAYEHARVRDCGVLPGDMTDDDRALVRRLIAQRCLYGVDLNPMAVQVARLSLWLATLAANRPLTFLDHHLASGNSLVGASLDDIARRPPGGGTHRRQAADLPLFPSNAANPALTRALPWREHLAMTPDDNVAAVRGKERLLSRLRDDEEGLGIWRHLADVWCSGWFWDAAAGPRPSPAVFADLAVALRGGPAAMVHSAVAAMLEHVRRVARESAFFHWTLEFPEVFFDASGAPRPDAGFDAVVTNPPWDMVREDSGTGTRRTTGPSPARHLLDFVRESGIYHACGEGHANLYQFFVERCLALTKPGGRLGLIVPWGLASDHGSAALRARLLDRCSVDALVGFENSGRVFPIHRGVRFLLLSATTGSATEEIRCRFGERDPRVLDALAGGDDRTGVGISSALLERLAGAGRAFPYVRARRDLQLLERLSHQHPALGSESGWRASFGRELNATDDRMLMATDGAIPVIEGKHLTPFRVTVDPGGSRVTSVARLPSRDLRNAVMTWRLAYRDVASSTNRLTLIAALVPPRYVTVHTVFCLKTALPLPDQAFVCAVLNSFVANYVARLWVTTHVSAGIIARIPVPRPPVDAPVIASIGGLALALRHDSPDWAHEYARLQVMVARLYGLSRDDFEYVLGTFPLVENAIKQECLEQWAHTADLIDDRQRPALRSRRMSSS